MEHTVTVMIHSRLLSVVRRSGLFFSGTFAISETSYVAHPLVQESSCYDLFS